jgi:(E)-4-hydroxy-3-methylbut-2-enyl-diphosphate synthase
VTVAVMGCVVNGPGEAANADVAVCCGKTTAAIYRGGEKLRTVKAKEIVPAILAEVEAMRGAAGCP